MERAEGWKGKSEDYESGVDARDGGDGASRWETNRMEGRAVQGFFSFITFLTASDPIDL